MAQVQAIYARSHTIGGLGIRHFDNGPARVWSHVGIALPDELVVVEARAFHRVKPVPLDAFADRYPVSEIVTYEVPNLTTGLNWLQQQCGLPYDYKAILGKMFRRSWEEPGAWHCQELLEAFLVACGLRRWRSMPNLITPNMGYANLCGVVR